MKYLGNFVKKVFLFSSGYAIIIIYLFEHNKIIHYYSGEKEIT